MLPVIAGGLVALVALSYVVEALRPQPVPPKRLGWAPDLTVSYIDVGDGLRLRYVTAGQGPALVLLHTLRTQLDMFQKVMPALAGHFRVYAVDLPGHGYSDIQRAEYSPEFFRSAVERFLEVLGIENAVVVGESIGGSIGLLLAARHNPRVRAVVAINAYDYDQGRGVRRSSLLANFLFGVSNVPVIGGTFMRLHSYPIVRRVIQGGLYRKESLPESLARELNAVGNRRGHYQALMSLIRHWPEWERARAEYGSIDRPVLLLYGDHDWSRPDEREANRRAVPGAEMRIVAGAGHFLALDAPEELVRSVVEFSFSR
ncbi:MAG: alpha/beta fold hydrolase [Gemmatimonadales bacterium]